MIKYIAGFFDADGSILLKWWKQNSYYRFTLQIEFSQHKSRSHILKEIQEYFGFGILRDKLIKNKYEASILTFTGDEALRVAERIHKHSVIKGDYTRYLIDVYRNMRGRFTNEKKKTLETSRKAKRKELNSKIFNYPSNKWFAGYVDGDGSLMCNRNNLKNLYRFRLDITSAIWDKEGVDLLHKVLGGSLTLSKKGHYILRINLDRPKIDKVLKPLAKHCKLKNYHAQVMIESLRKGKITEQTNFLIKALNTRND